MSDDELAATLERDYYALLAANTTAQDRGEPIPNDELGTLRQFLHSRGFTYGWLNQHGYREQPSHA